MKKQAVNVVDGAIEKISQVEEKFSQNMYGYDEKFPETVRKVADIFIDSSPKESRKVIKSLKEITEDVSKYARACMQHPSPELLANLREHSKKLRRYIKLVSARMKEH